MVDVDLRELLMVQRVENTVADMQTNMVTIISSFMLANNLQQSDISWVRRKQNKSQPHTWGEQNNTISH